MAESEGFEPSKGVNPYSLSRGAPSATRPTLHVCGKVGGSSTDVSTKTLYRALLGPSIIGLGFPLKGINLVQP